MNCNCIEWTRERMAEHYKAEAGDGLRVECPHLGINFGSGGMSLSIPFNVYGSARGFKSKGHPVNVLANHCPFCGRSMTHYVVGQDVALAQAFKQEIAA
jgi:hypothetical protein